MYWFLFPFEILAFCHPVERTKHSYIHSALFHRIKVPLLFSLSLSLYFFLCDITHFKRQKRTSDAHEWVLSRLRALDVTWLHFSICRKTPFFLMAGGDSPPYFDKFACRHVHASRGKTRIASELLLSAYLRATPARFRRRGFWRNSWSFCTTRHEIFLVSLKVLCIFSFSFPAFGERREKRQGAFGSRSESINPSGTVLVFFHLPIFRYRNLEGQMVPGGNGTITWQVYNSERAADTTGERRETVFSPFDFAFPKSHPRSFWRVARGWKKRLKRQGGKRGRSA